MITGGEVRDLVARARGRYEAWEERRRARFAGWSVRRRYVVLFLIPFLLCCCGGTVVGVPLAWMARMTIQAGKGAPTPDAAANEYLMALGYGQEDGLLPLLDRHGQGELLAQWRAYRAQMTGTTPPPARFDFAGLTVGPVHGGRAEVTTDVSATWWDTDAAGHVSMYQSSAYPWRIETHEDDGWRVSSVHAPAWCGGYVLASKCTTR